MNYLVVLVVGLILSASPGNCLRCYSCSVSTERCVTNTINCSAGERCYLLLAGAAGAKAYSAGCAPPAACIVQPNIPGASFSCCNTDLCNASDQVKLSLLLFPALVSVWFAIFM
ncbi:prostate stem cell antigen-like isoform X2 [Amblyraja radiata]|uniref:prostate stem cell antigen-like isoform X2 n=1 Tax=Amblyraja radiata TaxID=386614 RepID=UPI0014029872|nr:prostate stem cell antigen-like isoform X2 [Amblyraja radiata]